MITPNAEAQRTQMAQRKRVMNDSTKDTFAPIYWGLIHFRIGNFATVFLPLLLFSATSALSAPLRWVEH
jgi:hypothetical protein